METSPATRTRFAQGRHEHRRGRVAFVGPRRDRRARSRCVHSFYCRALDLEKTYEFDLEELGIRGVLVANAAGWTIELFKREGPTPHGRPPDPNVAHDMLGIAHFCLRTGGIRAAFDQLLAAGATSRLEPMQSPHRSSTSPTYLTPKAIWSSSSHSPREPADLEAVGQAATGSTEAPSRGSPLPGRSSCTRTASRSGSAGCRRPAARIRRR